MEQNYLQKQQQKFNQKIHYQIQTQHLVLKPYCKSFVKQYNQWFIDDAELLYLTGSQILTLQQEYQNHKGWITDPTKYTFIIFQKGFKNKNQSNNENNDTMIGDINLFFSEWIQPNECQINVMIALKQYRGKGYAKQALEIIQLFARGIYNKNEIIAKIKQDNIGSKKLFQKCGYKNINFNKGFNQYQLRKKIQYSKQQGQKILKERCKLIVCNDKQALFKI